MIRAASVSLSPPRARTPTSNHLSLRTIGACRKGPKTRLWTKSAIFCGNDSRNHSPGQMQRRRLVQNSTRTAFPRNFRGLERSWQGSSSLWSVPCSSWSRSTSWLSTRAGRRTWSRLRSRSFCLLWCVRLHFELAMIRRWLRRRLMRRCWLFSLG
jgi:hypothetical protein